jgi:hypothetical protein
MIDFKSDVTRQVVRGVCEGVVLSVVLWGGALALYWLFVG